MESKIWLGCGLRNNILTLRSVSIRARQTYDGRGVLTLAALERLDDDIVSLAAPGCVGSRQMSLGARAIMSPIGMMLVGCAAAWYWKRVSRAQARWFWIGVALWTVAVFIKLTIAVLTNAAVLTAIRSRVPSAWFVGAGGLFIGVQSSLCEVGLTVLAGLVWKQLGQDAGRAIAVGVGAWAFEAVLLGLAGLAGVVVWLSGVSGTELVGQQLQIAATNTPVFWLAAPIERVSAILVHAASRGLVLVGITHARRWMIVLGFLIFTLVDTVAGGAQISGLMNSISLWWIELAVAVPGVASLVSLRWLIQHFGADILHAVTRDQEQ